MVFQLLNYATSDKYSRGDADISVTQLIDSPEFFCYESNIRKRYPPMLWT